jgi:hypothetical protein
MRRSCPTELPATATGFAFPATDEVVSDRVAAGPAPPKGLEPGLLTLLTRKAAEIPVIMPADDEHHQREDDLCR